MKYKAVIFDLDDTLVQTAGVKWAHHKAVAKQFYDIDLTDEVLAEHWGKPFEQMMAILYQHADTPENMLKANLSLEHEFRKTLQPDTLPTIEALLARGIDVGVITSTLNSFAMNDLTRLGFPVDKFFAIHGADDVAAHKPDPKVFEKALGMLGKKGITHQQIVYVGDALMDYYAARDAGLGFVGVTTGFVTKEQFEAEGANVVPSLGQLLARI